MCKSYLMQSTVFYFLVFFIDDMGKNAQPVTHRCLTATICLMFSVV